jgi:hypothetical protein
MGRKLNYGFSFRPINLAGAREGDERAESVDLLAEEARDLSRTAATTAQRR